MSFSKFVNLLLLKIKYSIIRCVRGTVLWHVLYSMEEMGAGEG
jgi:hypothetical protein